jgi:hypothetical protein
MRLPTDLSSRYEYHSGRTQGTTTLPTHHARMRNQEYGSEVEPCPSSLCECEQ